MNKNKNDFKGFKCFSVPLKRFLMEKHGLEYIAVALDPRTKDTFWMFLKDEKLDKALIEWKETKPKKQ